jgi:hypothetical protein
MTEAQQPQREPKHLYLDKSIPEDFQNVDKGDWIYLVGDITTDYEVDFVRQFGHAMQARPHTPAPEQCPYWGERFGMMVCKYREIGNAEDEHDAAIARTATLAAYDMVIKQSYLIHDESHRGVHRVINLEDVESLRSTAEEEDKR